MDRFAYYGAAGWPSARDAAILRYPRYGYRVALIATEDMVRGRVFADVETDMATAWTLEHQHGPGANRSGRNAKPHVDHDVARTAIDASSIPSS